MRIVIDMQGAQLCDVCSPMAEHTINFSRAICDHSDGHEVLLAFDGRYLASIEHIRTKFPEPLWLNNIRFWYGAEPAGLAAGDQANANELIREAFLASLQPDIIHYTGDVFRSGEKSATFSIGGLSAAAPVTACFYQFPEVASQDALEERQKATLKRVAAFFDTTTALETVGDLPPTARGGGTVSASENNAQDVLIALNQDQKIHRVSARTGVNRPSTCAREVFAIWLDLCKGSRRKTDEIRQSGNKLRLAYVSPLPPERSGISDYSAELIPYLSEFYEIIVIADQASIKDPWILEHCEHHDGEWLRVNKSAVDRVIYHFGNSEFHKHMPSLLKDVPGVVVLHDFYLSGLYAWLEWVDAKAPVWTEALYQAHGYNAVAQRHLDPAQAQRDYPVSFDIISRAQGVIVHSEHSRALAKTWYPRVDAERWERIPLLRLPASDFERAEARHRLGLQQDAFIVCSFGFMGETKLNHRLLEAWQESVLSSDANSIIVFVGELPVGEYHSRIHGFIKQNKLSSQVQITGFADPKTYRLYLQAADIAVQLRSNSRGETSAAILDCMNHGLPVIANSNGSMAEIDPSTLALLDDNFTTEQLAGILVGLRDDIEKRTLLGSRAREYVIHNHAPEHCARLYAIAIERFQSDSRACSHAFLAKLADSLPGSTTNDVLMRLSVAISKTFPTPRTHRKLYIDITATIKNDLKTGIERVARAITIELLETPPEGYRVEPVYLSYVNGKWCYVAACEYTTSLLGVPSLHIADECVEITNEDTVLGLDISGSALIGSVEQGLIDELRLQGTRVLFMVFDLLPIRMPQVFPPGADESHEQWLKAVSSADGVIAISQHVAGDYRKWIEEADLHFTRKRKFKVFHCHLGADIDRSAPSEGLPDVSLAMLEHIRGRINFLMVGTIEPRKGYLEALEAFENLWRDGHDVNLIIVGREGWRGLSDNMRRDIPETIDRLRHHREKGERLFWLEGISDEFLERLYTSCTCLLAASYDEGFGLPLIEAAKHRLPMIVRDIPVFREVAEDHAYYFKSNNSRELAHKILDWIALYKVQCAPTSVGMQWKTWKESGARLSRILLDDDEARGVRQ